MSILLSRDWTRSSLNIKRLVRQIEPQAAQVTGDQWRKLPGTHRDQIVAHSSHFLSNPVTFSQKYAGPVHSY